jgi:Rad52/22 family double-strand break repair protein.
LPTVKTKDTLTTVAVETYVVICYKTKPLCHSFSLFIISENIKLNVKNKSMRPNKYLSVESLYLYADRVFGHENWSHEIKNQTIGQ